MTIKNRIQKLEKIFFSESEGEQIIIMQLANSEAFYEGNYYKDIKEAIKVARKEKVANCMIIIIRRFSEGDYLSNEYTGNPASKDIKIIPPGFQFIFSFKSLLGLFENIEDIFAITKNPFITF